MTTENPLKESYDVFDATGLIAGVLHRSEGSLEEWRGIQQTAQEQRESGKIWSPELTMVRLVEGLDPYNELESAIRSIYPDEGLESNQT